MVQAAKGSAGELLRVGVIGVGVIIAGVVLVARS